MDDMSAPDNLGGQFLERRHVQLRSGYASEAEGALHKQVDVYHTAGHHDWNVEKQQRLNAYDPPAENDPYDTVPKRGGTPHRKCEWCQSRGLPKGPRR